MSVGAIYKDYQVCTTASSSTAGWFATWVWPSATAGICETLWSCPDKAQVYTVIIFVEPDLNLPV